jgi:hypothetical protein
MSSSMMCFILVLVLVTLDFCDSFLIKSTGAVNSGKVIRSFFLEKTDRITSSGNSRKSFFLAAEDGDVSGAVITQLGRVTMYTKQGSYLRICMSYAAII